jgi:hypothetical protein
MCFSTEMCSEPQWRHHLPDQLEPGRAGHSVHGRVSGGQVHGPRTMASHWRPCDPCRPAVCLWRGVRQSLTDGQCWPEEADHAGHRPGWSVLPMVSLLQQQHWLHHRGAVERKDPGVQS